MQVKEILLKKGQEVKAVEKSATYEELARRMKREDVGALMVRTASGGLAGVVAERDLVRAFADFGLRALSLTAEQLMTSAAQRCAPSDSLSRVARPMTSHKVRHLPVVWRDRLVGVVSLGDVVKHRLDEVELETRVLRDLAARPALGAV